MQRYLAMLCAVVALVGGATLYNFLDRTEKVLTAADYWELKEAWYDARSSLSKVQFNAWADLKIGTPVLVKGYLEMVSEISVISFLPSVCVAHIRYSDEPSDLTHTRFNAPCDDILHLPMQTKIMAICDVERDDNRLDLSHCDITRLD